jgi:hypothetical protein
MRSDWLADKGYNPLPVARGKKFCHLKGWPTLKDWRGEAPGLGLALDGLVMIDIDIEDERVAEEIADLFDPERRLPVRMRENSGRLALLGRWKGPRTRQTTPKWAREGGGRVEVKAGASEFMFGWGTHPSGAELHWMVDGDEFPAFDDLPVLSEDAVIRGIVASTEHLRRLWGAPDEMGLDALTRETVHDLRWDMEFDCGDGTLATLEDLYEGPKTDVFVNLTPWRPESDSMGGHLTHGGEVNGPVLTDFTRNVVHLLAPDQDRDDSDIEINVPPLQATQERLSAARAAPGEGNVAKLAQALREDSGGDLVGAEWLNDLVYVQDEERIYVVSDPDARPLSKMGALGHLKSKDRDEVFRALNRAHQAVWDPRLPPRGVTTSRKGRRDFNLFTLPDHKNAGGDLYAFDQFVNGFIPDVFEREVLLDWLAAKVQSPWERHFAMVVVGPQGSGKGILKKIIGRLFGDGNVKTTGLKVLFEGRYDNALSQCLFTCVDETSSLSRKTYEKLENIEHLKRLVDPASFLMDLNIKGREMRTERVHTTFLFASNNSDALPLDDDHRRFCVLQTGPMLDPAQVRSILDWAEDDRNVATLWAALKSREVSINPMKAPETEAKIVMGEQNRTDVDDAVLEFQEHVLECGNVYAKVVLNKFLVQKGIHGPEAKVVAQNIRRQTAVLPFPRVWIEGNMYPMRYFCSGPKTPDHDRAVQSIQKLQRVLAEKHEDDI